MRVLLQRVSQAQVCVDGEIIGHISKGLVLLTGITHEDNKDKVEKMAEKLIRMRLFTDNEGKMNLSSKEVNGELLVVSQFTLYGDTHKGRRPSFVDAAHPEQAKPLINWFVQCFKARGMTVATGKFGANMQVTLTNDGPVTLMVEN